jgi:hypothetical protein
MFSLFTRQPKMKDEFEVVTPSSPTIAQEQPTTETLDATPDVQPMDNQDAPPSEALPETSAVADVPAKFQHIVNGVYSPPNAFYTQVSLTDDDVRYIGLIIGRGGFYFKKITEAARVDYIWYDPDRKAIEIWGPERRLLNAVNRVHARIHRVRKEVALKEE